MPNQLNERFQYLEELIRIANSLINPITAHDEMMSLMSKDHKKKLLERNPQCWLPVHIGRPIPFFPVCNRSGSYEIESINFSLKLAKKLVGNTKVDQEQLEMITRRLQNLKNKYSKDVPRPSNMAYRKGLTTKLLRKIRQYIDTEINGK